MKCKYMGAVVAAFLVIATSVAPAADLISIDFESGNLDAAGSSGDGWKFWSVSGNNRSQIGSTGRTFLTGSTGNDEALFINLANPAAGESDLEGAEWVSSTPLSVGQNDLVYLVTETFSDMTAFSDQFFKIDVRFGSAGDGAAYGGFDNALGGSTWSVNSNFNTEGSASNRQGRMGSRDANGNSTTAELLDIKYVGNDVDGGTGADVDNNPGDPANNFLDRTFIQKTLYRPGAGDGTQVNGEGQGIAFDGTNITRTFNLEGTKDNANDGLELMPAYGNLDIDRVSVHLRRHVGAYDGLFVGNPDDLNHGFAGDTGLASPFAPDPITGIIPNTENIKMGIKSIRIGVATAGDLDLDTDVDTSDVTNVVTNFTGDGGSTTETWFDGDLDNDMDVDTADITDTVTNFTGAVPATEEALNPGVPDLLYNPSNGEVTIDPEGVEIVSLSLTSAGAFIPNAADFSALDNAVGLESVIVDSTSNQVGWTSALIFNEQGYNGGPFSLGNILPTGLTQTAFSLLFSDTGWAQAGGGGGAFDIVVPEPSALCLLAAAFVLGAVNRRRIA